VSGPDDPEALVRRAQQHIRRRELGPAESLLLQALTAFGELPGAEINYSVCLNNLGMLYHVRGDDGRAEPLLLEVEQLRRRAAGPRHPLYRNCLLDLAAFYRSCNRLVEAERWQRRAEEVENGIQSRSIQSEVP
jgi:hypothetical protein